MESGGIEGVLKDYDRKLEDYGQKLEDFSLKIKDYGVKTKRLFWKCGKIAV
jgi:hypothetical protein